MERCLEGGGGVGGWGGGTLFCLGWADTNTVPAPRPLAHDAPPLTTPSHRLGGGTPSFRYLSQSDVFTLKDVDDAVEFG